MVRNSEPLIMRATRREQRMRRWRRVWPIVLEAALIGGACLALGLAVGLYVASVGP